MGELNVLILGDGILGSEIHKQTGWSYVSRKKDKFSIDEFRSFIPESYNIILNCIANTDTYSNDKNSHWDTNYRFVYNLANFCNEKKIKLVHISTDYIYSNSKNLSKETDVPVHCENWYSYTKLLSDGLIQLIANNFLIIRCSHKPNPFPYEFSWIDQIGNFDYVNVISELIVKLIKKDANGVFNVGTDLKNIHDLSLRTKQTKKIFSPPHVPKNISIDITKMENFLSENPFFSISIPTYGYNGKGGEFLEFSFKKLAEQSFSDFEIVVSDHSVDSTIKDICDKWSSKLKISHSFNEEGRGLISPNINESLKRCKGRWIKILFQDDFIYDSVSLEKQYNFIQQNQDTFWFFSEFYHSNDGINFYRHYLPEWNDTVWCGNNTLGCPSGLTLRNKDLIFFDNELNFYMDCDFYQRMFLKYGKPLILDQITVVNRTWGDRLTDTIPENVKKRELLIVSEKYGRSKKII
jgi:dTDP-4-dehydrorhamnose reductase